MLHFTDLSGFTHLIYLTRISHLQYRKNESNWVLTFHLVGPHMTAVTVDDATCLRVTQQLGIKL